MKKALTAAALVAAVFALTACGDTKEATPAGEVSQPQTADVDKATTVALIKANGDKLTYNQVKNLARLWPDFQSCEKLLSAPGQQFPAGKPLALEACEAGKREQLNTPAP